MAIMYGKLSSRFKRKDSFGGPPFEDFTTGIIPLQVTLLPCRIYVLTVIVALKNISHLWNIKSHFIYLIVLAGMYFHLSMHNNLSSETNKSSVSDWHHET